MRFHILAWAIVSYCSLTAAYGQVNPQKFKIQKIDSLAKDSMRYVINPGQKKPTNEQSDSDTTRIIVRLKTSPVASGSQGRIDLQSVIQTEHEEFLAVLRKLDGNATSGRNASQPTSILFDYRVAFNGYALITSRAIARELQSLKIVSSVTVDKKVRAVDVTSNDIIKAPQAWSVYGITGKNIKIGIIDTGVDYSHPDLGGGFGPSFKVVGGFDFFNNDDDPMDDNGHGTHVAGIAAANGQLKGVAPDAKIYAYKVLGRDGYGYDSQILAAIERSVDPDQNPNTNDALDVVNMSLGRYADAAEPLSEAVNNATALGVVYVVAAGNSYNNFTIGTPGIAKNAITVGATDAYNYTAYFSSKGPVENTFALKPDIAAPGVGINSCSLQGGYKVESGTSMASPHVAGAVALLLEKYPSWTPEMIKALLMNTATPFTSSIWEQGAGVMDVYKAAEQNFLVSPASISLGLVDRTIPVSTKNYTLTVRNTSASAQQYTVSLDDSKLHSAISISFTPSTFTLSSHTHQTVEITITVNTAQLPKLNSPDAYLGFIQVNNGSATVSTTLALVNPKISTLQFTGELPLQFFVIGLEGSSYWTPFTVNRSQYDLFLPDGKYDIITYYQDSHIVIEEDFSSSDEGVVVQDKSMAKNTIEFSPIDVTGNSLLDGNQMGTAMFTGKGRNFTSLYFGFLQTVHISDNNNYKFNFKYFGKPQNKADQFYDITESMDYGIQESRVLKNDPEAFNSVVFRDPTIGGGPSKALTYYASLGMPWFYIITKNTSPFSVTDPLKVYFSKVAPDVLTLGVVSWTPGGSDSGYGWGTAHIKALDEALQFSLGPHESVATVPSTSYEYNFGQSLLSFNGSLRNENKIYLHSFPERGLFRHGLGDRQDGSVRYTLSTGGSVVKTGSLHNGTVFSSEGLELPGNAQRYTLSFEYNDYQVRGKSGAAKATLEFDLSQNDQNAPALLSLQLFVNNFQSDRIQPGDQAYFKFRLIDHCSDYWWCQNDGVRDVSLSIKRIDSEEWIQLNHERYSDFDFQSNVPADLQTGYYQLRLNASDYANNSFLFESAPAFLVGEQTASDPFVKINLIYPKHRSINAGTTPVFSWSTMNNGRYIFQITDDPAFTERITEIETSEASLSLPTALTADHVYYWRVKGITNSSSTNWSTIGRFTSSTLYPARLISPSNHSTDHSISVLLDWDPAPVSSSNILQVSKTPDFYFPYEREEWVDGESSFLLNGLEANVTYYWRVVTFIWGEVEDYFLHSETFNFTTGPSKRTFLIAPANQAVNQSLTVEFSWTPVNGATSYWMELSTSPGFNTPGRLFPSLNNTKQIVMELEENTTYYWRVSVYVGSSITRSDTFSFTTGVSTSVELLAEDGDWYNYPNPFAGETVFRGNARHSGEASIIILDQLGHEVYSFRTSLQTGLNEIVWNGKNRRGEYVANGVYTAFIHTGDVRRKMIRLVIQR